MPKIFIEVEIFDDGELPTTCARELGTGKVCPYFDLSSSEDYCTLFKRKLDQYRPEEPYLLGFVKPCIECLNSRLKKQSHKKYSPIRKMSKKDKKEVYNFAIKRSKEILEGGKK